MFQIAFDEKSAWLEKLAPQLSTKPPIEPRYARRAVNLYLGYHVTMMTLAGDPTLHVGEQPVWHVPILFAAPHTGPVATIGYMNVDALTGDLEPLSQDEIDQLLKFADALAANLPSFTIQRN